MINSNQRNPGISGLVRERRRFDITQDQPIQTTSSERLLQIIFRGDRDNLVENKKIGAGGDGGELGLFVCRRWGGLIAC